ncbi:hypothetical protein Tco_0098779 [Tanacetum coccineum]
MILLMLAQAGYPSFIVNEFTLKSWQNPHDLAYGTLMIILDIHNCVDNKRKLSTCPNEIDGMISFALDSIVTFDFSDRVRS